MKNLIVYSLALIFCLGACKKDNKTTPDPTTPKITRIVIEINSPGDGADLDLEIPVSVQVLLTRENNGRIDKAKIEILDVTNNVLKTLIDEEVNKLGTYSFNNINGFMAATEGAYKIRVTASDANGQNAVIKIHKFTLQ